MKLQHVDINNFKSMNQAAVEGLAPINVFFGPTNSGKTSLLESVYFQFHHQFFSKPDQYFEFLHSKADPHDAVLMIQTRWLVEEPIPTVNIHQGDIILCQTSVRFSNMPPKGEDIVYINGIREENHDRIQAVFHHLRNSVKFSSSRRPGDSKQAYFPTGEETHEQRQQRFYHALQELSLQGENYSEFLSHLQRMFPHLVYGPESERTIMEFFGTGFIGTAKLFAYLFDARYSLVLIDEPEIHFYPSLTRRFVSVLHEVVEQLNKQIILSTHSSLFLQEKQLGNFYHIAKSKHFITQVRRVDQNHLLEGLDMLNVPAEAIMQSDVVLYAEGPTDVAVLEEWLAKFPELKHIRITVLHLGGGSMGNLNVDPVKLKIHNPLSLVIVDSERKGHGGMPEPSHAEFMKRCDAARLFCMMTERQAIENYLTPRALRVVFGKSIPGNFTNAPYLPLKKQGLRWYEKSSNRAVARAMTREEVESFPDMKRFFTEIIRLSKQLQ